MNVNRAEEAPANWLGWARNLRNRLSSLQVSREKNPGPENAAGQEMVEKYPMADSATDERGLAATILAYFVEHPEAVDNLEGISGWRLLSTRVRSTVESTQQVLELLVRQGYLQKIETASGPLYQINQENREAAEKFLRPSENSQFRETGATAKEITAVDIKIRNQAKHLLLVPLSSRATLHLAPGEVSAPVNELEISRNDKVAKLVNRGLIKILSTESEKD